MLLRALSRSASVPALAACVAACGPTPDASTSGATGSTTSGGASTGEASGSTSSGATGSGSESDGTSTGEPAGACDEAFDEAAVPIPWDPGQPALDGCEVRGGREYRAIIHLHSPHSHDACDGDPQPGGALDEACLQDLRDGLCETRIDVAFLTDHPSFAEDATIEAMVLSRGDDEVIKDGEGRVVGNWIACASGHRVLVLPGIESGEMMPLGLSEHAPPGTYGTSSAAAFAAIRDAGGVAWVAHTEGRDVAELATLGLDGIELYQLHANLDPDIREQDLGLDPGGFLADTLPFFFPVDDSPPEPDLASLAFVVPNEPSIVALETLGQSQRLTISGGTDAHENVLPQKAPDGERIDSYRRMMRWFNNRLRLDGPLSVDAAKAALVAGRNHIVFESFGTPKGFDLHARSGEAIVEMGAELSLGGGAATIEATLPTLDRRSPRSSTPPEIRGVLYRADGEGRAVVREWSEGSLSQAIDAPGVYRVEVMITPRHLGPYLGSSADKLVGKEIVWIYSGAIFVRP